MRLLDLPFNKPLGPYQWATEEIKCEILPREVCCLLMTASHKFLGKGFKTGADSEVWISRLCFVCLGGPFVITAVRVALPFPHPGGVFAKRVWCLEGFCS